MQIHVSAMVMAVSERSTYSDPEGQFCRDISKRRRAFCIPQFVTGLMQRIAQEDFSAYAHEAYKEAITTPSPVPIIYEREYLPMWNSR